MLNKIMDRAMMFLLTLGCLALLVMVLLTGAQGGLAAISRRSWLFLILSGLATGASWLCYYRALQLGEVSKVVPIDKLSVVITVLLAFLDRDPKDAAVAFDDNEMSYLHQHLFWRVGKHDGADPLPEMGDELWVRIPPDRVYLVTR